MTFTANGEYLVCGGWEGVGVWRVKNGERVATMQAVKGVRCVAVSKDGRFIAMGSWDGDVVVWDATTYKQVFVRRIDPIIQDVDFSPDATQLISANGDRDTATIWDVTAGKKVQTLDHGSWVLAAKYSPQGDRIATANQESVRVWDGDDGRLLVNVKVGLDPWRGLLWFDNHLFVKIDNTKIRQIDASTGLTVSEWSAPHNKYSCIALPQHGKFIACSTKANITFWDTLTHTQLALLPSSENGPIAFSPDDRIAIVAQEKKIIIKTLSVVKVCPVLFRSLLAREHVSLSHTKGPGHWYRKRRT